METQNINCLFYKNAYLSVSAVMFCKKNSLYCAFFKMTSGIHRRLFEGRHLVIKSTAKIDGQHIMPHNLLHAFFIPDEMQQLFP